MLEILILITFGRKLRDVAKAKGRSGSWAILGVVFWIVGEMFGLLIGGMMGLELGAYLTAIACAAVGAGIAYMIVNSLSTLGASPYDAGGDGGVEAHLQDPNNPFNPPGRS